MTIWYIGTTRGTDRENVKVPLSIVVTYPVKMLSYRKKQQKV